VISILSNPFVNVGPAEDAAPLTKEKQIKAVHSCPQLITQTVLLHAKSAGRVYLNTK
jgi:hypothetical protein